MFIPAWLKSLEERKAEDCQKSGSKLPHSQGPEKMPGFPVESIATQTTRKPGATFKPYSHAGPNHDKRKTKRRKGVETIRGPCASSAPVPYRPRRLFSSLPSQPPQGTAS